MNDSNQPKTWAQESAEYAAAFRRLRDADDDAAQQRDGALLVREVEDYLRTEA